MDQSRAPILEAIESFQAHDPAMFIVHGHKCGAGVDRETLRVLGRDAFASDMAATKGLDDRADRKKIVEHAERLASELLGADQTFFVVNGSSSSIQAALMAVV